MEVSRAVGERRLLKLADRLDTVPRKQFDYCLFVGDDWKGAPDLSCGTTACALGWATTIPSFRRQGLRFSDRDDVWHNVEVELYRDGELVSEESFTSGELFFGLSANESTFLFAPQSNEYNATAKRVAKKIRKFVKARAAS